MKPPVAPRRPYTHTEHGIDRPDPYHWMRAREDPDLLPYIEAENAYTEAALAPTADLRARLYAEMLGRIQEDDQTAPVPHGGWLYYSRTESGKPYRIYCRREGPDAPEQVMLDGNALAEGREYFSLGATAISPDHRLLAYAVDFSGAEVYELCVLDLETGALLPDTRAKIFADLAWANDNRTLFFTRIDDTWRPDRVFRMRLGTPPEDDAVILREPDTRFRVSVSRTRSGRFLVLTCAASRSTEVHLLAADAPDSDPRLVAARQPEHEYSVTHQGERLLIRSNADGALNFKLMEAPEAGGPWTELVPHRDDVHLTGVTGFADWYVLQERESARRQVRVVDLKTGAAWVAPADETASVSWVGDNREYGARVLRYGYSSMKTPESVFEIDLDTRARALRKRAPVLGGFAPDDYHSTRWEIPAPDGALIPVSVVWRGDATPPADAPTLLYGYGSYGMSVDPRFSSARLSLLDRGVVYAIAHIRGSSARGRAWYEAGRTAQKQNTFTDFIAVARALVDRGVTRPDRLAIRGGSAGGLLMGACMNQAPALFRAAVAQVPFVDVVSTMLDESIPLTTNEWEEWGDPRSREDFERMRAWSPYDNVAAAEYPALLITSGLNDPRVQYWEPTKWMARLRHRATTRGPLLLKTHMGAGHGGKSGRYGRLEGEARTFGFLLDQLGLAD